MLDLNSSMGIAFNGSKQGSNVMMIYNPFITICLPEIDLVKTSFHEIYHLHLTESGIEKSIKTKNEFQTLIGLFGRHSLLSIAKDFVPSVSLAIPVVQNIGLFTGGYYFKGLTKSNADPEIENRCDEFSDLIYPQYPISNIIKNGIEAFKENGVETSKPGLYNYIFSKHPSDDHRIEYSKITEQQGLRIHKKHGIKELAI